jgi:hypothetical protein
MEKSKVSDWRQPWVGWIYEKMDDELDDEL